MLAGTRTFTRACANQTDPLPIACVVGKIGDYNSILLGQAVRGLARAEVEHSCYCSDNDHGGGSTHCKTARPSLPILEYVQPDRDPET